MLDERAGTVGVAVGAPAYDAAPPFGPGVPWPEGSVFPASAVAASSTYAAVREALRLVGLDAERFGSSAWNPLRGIVRPGDTVVLKPNFVRDFRETSPDHADCLVTHGAVIRAVLDYAYLALEGRGRLVIADAPHSDADFEAVRRITGVDAIRELYARHLGFEVELFDLRPEAARKLDGVIVGHRPLPGDPRGYVKVDLGPHSAFEEIGRLCERLYGSEYDRRELVSHHTGGAHEYLLSRTVLEADCVISLPKLKTHKKTGLTANMKNLVGINGNKNWLPHHREGTPRQGGDQFADEGLLHRTERATMAVFKRVFPMLGPLRGAVARPIKSLGRGVFGDTNTETIRSGNWYGNDTTWRMVIDLNRILFYARADGTLTDRPARRFFSLVDGIVGGEGNGPLDPRPRGAGLIVAGFNPIAVDLACARLMGFDPRKIPMLRRALEGHALPLSCFTAESVRCRSNAPRFDRVLGEMEGPLLGFTPHFGWKGHIEVDEPAREASAIA